MNQEKKQGLIVGAITFVLVVIFFLFIGSETSTTSTAAPAPTNNNSNSGLLMAVTFTLTLLGLIALNHFRSQETPKGLLFTKEDDNISCPLGATDLPHQLAQTRRDLQNSQREYQNALTTIKQLQEAILNLFGTTDLGQITSTISALYHELSELRSQKEQLGASAHLDKQLTRQQELTTRLANERNQATALLAAIRQALAVDETAQLIQIIKELASQAESSQNWQKKAEEAEAQVAELQDKIQQANRWQELEEEELRDFFKTVTLDAPR